MNFERVVSVYILNDKKQVLMLKHKKIGTWAPPGGHVEEGELLHQAAIREIEEETGIRVEFIYDYGKIPEEIEETKTIILKVRMVPSPIFVEHDYFGDHYHEHFIYLVKAKDDKIINNENHEMDWFSFEQALELDAFEQIRWHLKHIKELIER